jgi:hypothetical protein
MLGALASLIGTMVRADDPPAPVELTGQEDHQRTMELLGIKELRRGANPRDPAAPNAVNYDEPKANPYPNLPEPLVMKDGRKVTTAQMWWIERRPEVVLPTSRYCHPWPGAPVRFGITHPNGSARPTFSPISNALRNSRGAI